MKGDGKKLEREMYTALKAVGAKGHTSQRELLPVDRVSFLPPTGRGVAIECKESRTGKFEFRKLSSGERRFLAAAHDAGAVSLLVVQHVLPARSRTWAIRWVDLVELWPALTGSFRLEDERRPIALIELRKVERAHGLGPAWDLSPFLDAVAV